MSHEGLELNRLIAPVTAREKTLSRGGSGAQAASQVDLPMQQVAVVTFFFIFIIIISFSIIIKVDTQLDLPL